MYDVSGMLLIKTKAEATAEKTYKEQHDGTTASDFYLYHILMLLKCEGDTGTQQLSCNENVL